ncbi:MAG: hypothetical protein SH849_10725 [Terricaulis sp.]|nr:hypothetical protein [Terricaulis sp.]
MIPVWIGVTRRFSAFDSALLITADVRADGEGKANGIVQSLNRHYFGVSDRPDSGLVVGSWGKGTAKTPTTDVDIFYKITRPIFDRFNSHQGNGQSALLQDVREGLLQTYPQSKIRGDGQVVVVDFNTLTVEVVPALPLPNGQFLIPDTNGGGSWRSSDPVAENFALQFSDDQFNANCRRLVRMIKSWCWYCSVPIKSFCIEILMTQFLLNSAWRQQSFYFYDWLTRDFFEYLIQCKGQILSAPGTYEPVILGSEWLSKAESAYSRAVKACVFEYQDQISEAGEEWQKIFGARIPVTV